MHKGEIFNEDPFDLPPPTLLSLPKIYSISPNFSQPISYMDAIYLTMSWQPCNEDPVSFMAPLVCHSSYSKQLPFQMSVLPIFCSPALGPSHRDIFLIPKNTSTGFYRLASFQSFNFNWCLIISERASLGHSDWNPRTSVFPYRCLLTTLCNSNQQSLVRAFLLLTEML